MGVLENWQQWTQFLGEQVEDAKDDGMSKKFIDQAALHIGEYLAKNIEPQTNKSACWLIYGMSHHRMKRRPSLAVSLN